MNNDIYTQIDNNITTSETRIKMGTVCCSFICNDANESGNLQKLFSNFITEQAPDITIRLNIQKSPQTESEDESGVNDRQIESGETIGTNSQIRKIHYDKAQQLIQVDIDKEVPDEPLEYNLINRLLTRAYYSIDTVGGDNKVLLVHSCGIVRNEKVILFMGPSGAGKTTVGRMCGEEYGSVINDEMLLIEKTPNGYMVHGCPIIGEYPQQLNISAPLLTVLFLKQSANTAIHPMKRSTGYMKFIRQILPPSSIGDNDDKGTLSAMADFTSDISASIPFFELEFSLNREPLWEEIQKLEKEL